MLFNSIDFAIFFPVVFFLYWFVFKRNLKVQNLFVVAASYVFYGWWDWRFLILIFASTVVDYVIGRGLAKNEEQKKRKILLWISIIVNIGLLGFFKYFNFFVDSFITAFSLFGISLKSPTLHIILPVGISFYTFQTMSYTIDVYRRNLAPTKDFIAFTAFVSFFPQLVAGPIERATNLLPQFFAKREFNYKKAVDGLKQILWGLFKKIVIADQCGVFVDRVYENQAIYPGSMLLLGAIFFAFQAYGDFSGYSDIAIGTARLLGFNLSRNFAYPYFSRNFTEFWRRWHISLSSWFRDYVYIPLGGSKSGTAITIRNTFIVFILSGLWHGANWTFIIWGALNAFYILPQILFPGKGKHKQIVAYDRNSPTFKELVAILGTFLLHTLSIIFFRSETINGAFGYFNRLFSASLFSLPPVGDIVSIVPIIILIVFFIIMEWIGRREEYAIARTGKNQSRIVRWSFYSFVIFLIGMYMHVGGSPFIYFQF